MDLLRPVQGLHGPGGAAGGRPRHRRCAACRPSRSGWWVPTRMATTTWARAWARISRWTSGPTCAIGEARRLLPRVRASAGRRAAASRWPRSSSWATSTPAPWALPSWTRTARRSPSSWAATAWASRARWPPSWSSTTTSTASCGRLSVAPAHICVVPLTVGDAEVQPMAEKIAKDLAELGFEVVIDDRDERAGVKFNDADLIGWPAADRRGQARPERGQGGNEAAPHRREERGGAGRSGRDDGLCSSCRARQRSPRCRHWSFRRHFRVGRRTLQSTKGPGSHLAFQGLFVFAPNGREPRRMDASRAEWTRAAPNGREPRRMDASRAEWTRAAPNGREPRSKCSMSHEHFELSFWLAKHQFTAPAKNF